jgi:hypothetical protein
MSKETAKESGAGSGQHCADGVQIERWQQARSWYQQSLNVWIDLRTQGKLRASDADQPARIADQLARSDVALAKLRDGRSGR